MFVNGPSAVTGFDDGDVACLLTADGGFTLLSLGFDGYRGIQDGSAPRASSR